MHYLRVNFTVAHVELDGFLLENPASSGAIASLAVGPAGSLYVFHRDATRAHWGSQKIKILEQTRDLFTDVLIPPTNDPDRKKQLQVIKTLGGKNWPARSVFGAVKRNPEALLTAAEIYAQSAPQGVDGRQVALRLIAHLHEFLLAVADPEHPKLEEKIPIWWAAAQLKLEIYLAITKGGAGPVEKDMAKKGADFARKLIFQYPNMDGPERVQAIKSLEAQLKARAR